MGKLLDEYLAQNVPALQDIVRGQPQPEGATTFPLPEQSPLQAQPIGAGGSPTGPMASMPPEGAVGPGPGAPAPSFDAPGQAPQPAMPPVQAQAQPDRTAEFDKGENSFAGMAEKADPKSVNSAIDSMEKAGTNIDEEYAKITGTEPEKSENDPTMKKKSKDLKGKLTRQEKALILMEFGLSLMASSGSGEGTIAGDIGQAGMQAFGGHQRRETAKAKAATEAEEREQKRRLTEAQIKKAEEADTVVKADRDGNFIVVDQQSGESKPVLMDGEPVQAANADKFASEVDRMAYEGLECEGLKGSALKSCKRRALAYAKGGGANVAFPELERADQTDRVMKNLEDPDKASSRYRIPSTGQLKRWKLMTPDEQLEVAQGFVERRMEIINSGSIETGSKKAGGFEDPDGLLSGMDSQARAGMVPGKIYTLSNKTKVRIRNGKVEQAN